MNLIRYLKFIDFQHYVDMYRIVACDEGHFQVRYWNLYRQYIFWKLSLFLLIFFRDMRRIWAVGPIGEPVTLTDRVRLGDAFSLTVGLSLNPAKPIFADHRTTNTSENFADFLEWSCQNGCIVQGQVHNIYNYIMLTSIYILKIHHKIL